MKLYRFKSLDITSAKKPFNTHLLWEHATYGLVMVDSTDQTVLLISTDEGDNWSTIDLSDNANSYKIQAGWLDGNDLWLVMCDNDGTADDFEVCFIELDDSNDCNPIGVSVGGGGGAAENNTVYASDIFKLGANFYVLNAENRINGGNVPYFVVWDVDTHPFTEKDTVGRGDTSQYATYGVVVGTKYYSQTSGLNFLELLIYDDTIPSIILSSSLSDYEISDDENQWSNVYDGSNIIYFVAQYTNGDNKYYFVQYSITGDSFTIGGEYNIVLMLTRNNSAIAPNDTEKAFGTANEITYEIKPRGGGIVQLQDISALLAGNIVGMTDNYLFADDDGGTWDMYEFTNIQENVSEIYQTNGILGILNNVSMVIHPDFEGEWNEGDSFKVYDPNDVLAFWGKIINKSRDSRGIYIIQAGSFTNEVYKTIYEKTYSADDSDTKQKDIIDNGCNFCYRSSSIVGTTTTYSYVYNRAIAYLFYLNRFLERQVPYIEPDGKFWTKAYDGLSKNALIYPGKYGFKDVPVGTQGTNIDWVDSVKNTNTSTEIIAGWGGHRNIIQQIEGVANDWARHTFSSQSKNGWFESWVSTNDATGISIIAFREGAAYVFIFRFNADKFQIHTGGAYRDVAGAPAAADDIWYHFYIEWYDDDTFDFWIDGVQYEDGTALANAFGGAGVDTVELGQNNLNDKIWLDTPQSSLDDDPAYNVGDNVSAWNLANSWQEMSLVDIPYIKEVLPGYYRGNLEITRATVRYKNNNLSIKPDDYLTLEQTAGINPLEEYRDQRIEASPEADQLADNLHDIFNLETEIIGIHIEGQGYLQPGKTVDFRNTGQITIVQQDLLVIQYRYDMKNDIYLYLVLSDNIVFPNEWTTYNNTIQMQNSQTTIQSFENQEDINLHLTKEGGLACRLTNKTGVASIKGTIVEAHAATDNAFRVCDASSVESFGVVYEDGVTDGSECLVVIGGRCQVLLKDATASTRGNWVEVSDVAGRADATGASPAAAPQHFQEIGHCIESKGADTDVLAYCMLHFL